MQARNFAMIKRYTKSHEWIEYDSDTLVAKMGITIHAAHELGDIVHADLPESGTKFAKSEVVVTVESTKTAADVYQMCDGEVLERNDALADDVSLVNEDAEGAGWLLKILVGDTK